MKITINPEYYAKVKKLQTGLSVAIYKNKSKMPKFGTILSNKTSLTDIKDYAARGLKHTITEEESKLNRDIINLFSRN
ncbi:MAG: hypothetical protein WC389_20280 [Lutibacter sp.]|jgi:hypothetical protein